MEDKGYFHFSGSVYAYPSLCWLSVSRDMGSSSYSGTGVGGEIYATFPTGNLCCAFRQIRKEQRTFPASVDASLLSAQNSPCAKVAYLGGGIFWIPNYWLHHLPFAVLLANSSLENGS